MENYNNTNDETKMFRISDSDVTKPYLSSKLKQSNPTLTIVKGPQTGLSFELIESEITIGRDPSNQVFLNDMTVSRKHAKITKALGADAFNVIEDLESLNGTWVNGAIINKAILQDGATIQIGTFRMIFHTVDINS